MYVFKTEQEKDEQARGEQSVKDFARWLATSNEGSAVELRGGERVTNADDVRDFDADAIVSTYKARNDTLWAALRRHADTVYAHYHVVESTHGLRGHVDEFDCGPFRTLEAARRAMAQLVADSEDAGNPYQADGVDAFVYGPHSLTLVECTESFQDCWLANDPRPFGGHYNR